LGWYVVATEPARRGQVDWAVEKGIRALGLNTLLIEAPRITPSKRAFETPTILVLPGYVFAQFDLGGHDGQWQKIKDIHGVKTLLGLGPGKEYPSAVRPADFERLQKLAFDIAHQEIVVETKPIPLKPETLVRVLWLGAPGAIGKIEFDNGIRADVLLIEAGVASKISLPRELIEALH
jgi:transcription antitermination factor NusG